MARGRGWIGVGPKMRAREQRRSQSSEMQSDVMARKFQPGSEDVLSAKSAGYACITACCRSWPRGEAMTFSVGGTAPPL